MLDLEVSSHNSQGDAVITKPESIARAVGHAWEETFARKDIDQEAVAELLAEYSAKTWDWTLSMPPSRDKISNYMQDLTDCAPSMDGIINSAWKHSGAAGVDCAAASLSRSPGG